MKPRTVGRSFIFWLLLLTFSGATAEQHVWSFTLEGGGLGGATEIYASQNFPTDTVSVGAEFNVYNMIVSSDTTHDMVPDGILVTGCEVVSTDVFPGTNESNYRTEVVTLLMTDEACSVSREVRIWNDAQTTLLYTHNFVFTVESHQHIEIGDSDTFALTTFWLPFALLTLVFAFSLWQGYTFPLLVSLAGLAMEFFENPPIAFVGVVYFLLVAFILEYFIGSLKGLGKRGRDDEAPW